MKANELRIGNYVLFNKKIDIVGGINESVYGDAILFLEEYGNGANENISPIPLTERWLLDFGFVKGKKYFKSKEYGEEGIFTTMCYDLESKDFIVNSNDYDSYIIECVYVHQLQNLFFALTGEELIKK